MVGASTVVTRGRVGVAGSEGEGRDCPWLVIELEEGQCAGSRAGRLQLLLLGQGVSKNGVDRSSRGVE